MCKHCMNLQDGTFVQWPMGPLWEDNEFHLQLMTAVWEGWRYHNQIRRADAKWTTWHINYDTWLNKDRPQSQSAKTDYELWIEQREKHG